MQGSKLIDFLFIVFVSFFVYFVFLLGLSYFLCEVVNFFIQLFQTIYEILLILFFLMLNFPFFLSQLIVDWDMGIWLGLMLSKVFYFEFVLFKWSGMDVLLVSGRDGRLVVFLMSWGFLRGLKWESIGPVPGDTVS